MNDLPKNVFYDMILDEEQIAFVNAIAASRFPVIAHGRRKKKMALRKIDLMHRIFGICECHTCGECSNLDEYPYNKRTYRKCKAYGNTDSEASDWAKRWIACGLFNKPWEDKPIMRLVRPTRTDKEEAQRIPLVGQLCMEVEHATKNR